MNVEKLRALNQNRFTTIQPAVTPTLRHLVPRVHRCHCVDCVIGAVNANVRHRFPELVTRTPANRS